jgi:hypothetical protein
MFPFGKSAASEPRPQPQPPVAEPEEKQQLTLLVEKAANGYVVRTQFHSNPYVFTDIEDVWIHICEVFGETDDD